LPSRVRNVEEALTRIVLVERNAHTQYLALAIGTLHPLSEEEIAAINQTTSSDKALRKAFEYERDRRRAGAFSD